MSLRPYSDRLALAFGAAPLAGVALHTGELRLAQWLGIMVPGGLRRLHPQLNPEEKPTRAPQRSGRTTSESQTLSPKPSPPEGGKTGCPLSRGAIATTLRRLAELPGHHVAKEAKAR